MNYTYGNLYCPWLSDYKHLLALREISYNWHRLAHWNLCAILAYWKKLTIRSPFIHCKTLKMYLQTTLWLLLRGLNMMKFLPDDSLEVISGWAMKWWKIGNSEMVSIWHLGCSVLSLSNYRSPYYTFGWENFGISPKVLIIVCVPAIN